MKNFILRSVTAVAFGAAIIFALIFDIWPFIVLFLMISTAALVEFYKLSRLLGVHPQMKLGLGIGALFFLSNGLVAANYFDSKILLLNILPLTLPLILELYRRRSNPLKNVAFTYLGLLYVVGPMSLLLYFPNIRFEQGVYEPEILLGFFALLWVNDSVAYLFGSRFGKHLFFERISPLKTWEGAISGAVVTIALSNFAHSLMPQLSHLEWVIMAILVVVFSTFGDLFESLFKRSIKVKDSGNMLPGHGGILDRFDGVLVAAPVVFVYLIFAH